MPVLVDSVDYINKRIYLSSDTVGIELDTLDVYREVRARRRTDSGDRRFLRMIVAGGNIQKTATTFTPAYVQLLNGCRIVPFDTTHTLCLCRDTFTDDNLSGQDVFDRSSLSVNTTVDIDVNVQEVEIRTITLNGANVITGDLADVAAQVQAGMSAQGFTAALATELDGLDPQLVAILSEIQNGTYGLTAIKALLDTLGIDSTAIKAKTDALNISNGNVQSDVRAVTGQTVSGSGTENDPWGP